MSDQLRQYLQHVFTGRDLTADEMHAAIGEVMEGQCSEVLISSFLTALKCKGEAESEIAGAARAMQEKATPIPTTKTGLLDTCGTGGDELHTFNISTATAFVAAACGVPIAKHGNRSVSSSSGSADVLEALGVNLQLTPDQVAKCLDEVGIGFCFAPLIHGAMKYAMPVRRELGFRTIFNLLGPLTNPARAEFQLLGANNIPTAEKLAIALTELKRNRVIVVCGNEELDEVSLWGTTRAYIVNNAKLQGTNWTPKTFDLPACDVNDLKVNSAEESADVLRRIFAGEQGPHRNIVLANTAAALFASKRATSLAAGVEQAAAAVDAGKAKDICERLAEWTSSQP